MVDNAPVSNEQRTSLAKRFDEAATADRNHEVAWYTFCALLTEADV